MERMRALVAGVLVIAGIFGSVMALRIASRAMWAAARLLETLGVLALAVAAGWLVYRALVGDSYDPREADEFDPETADELEPETADELEPETTDVENA